MRTCVVPCILLIKFPCMRRRCAEAASETPPSSLGTEANATTPDEDVYVAVEFSLTLPPGFRETPVIPAKPAAPRAGFGTFGEDLAVQHSVVTGHYQHTHVQQGLRRLWQLDHSVKRQNLPILQQVCAIFSGSAFLRNMCYHSATTCIMSDLKSCHTFTSMQQNWFWNCREADRPCSSFPSQGSVCVR